MLICSQGHVVPNDCLACPACLAQRGEKALRDLQVEFLRRAARGETELRLTRDRQKHVLMYWSFTHTFCGIQVWPVRRINYEPCDEDTLAKICMGCRDAIATVMREVA